MISIYELAILSGHIYQSSKLRYLGYNFQLIDSIKHSQQKGLAKVDDGYFNMRPAKNFYAGLYIKFRHYEACEAVIAMRGTIPARIDNDLVDIYLWFSSAVGTNRALHARLFELSRKN